MKQSQSNEKQKPSLVLVGFVPYDIMGPARLYETLASVRPDAISVEYDDEAVTAMHKRKWEESDELAGLLRKHKLQWNHGWTDFLDRVMHSDGFDYRVAHDFAARAGIPVIKHHLVTNKLVLRENAFMEYLRECALGDKPALPDLSTIATEDEESYEAVRELLRNPQNDAIDDYLSSNHDWYLDLKIAPQVRKHVQQGKTLAHICKAGSLLDDWREQTLYCYLKDLNPERVLIYEGSLEMARQR